MKMVDGSTVRHGRVDCSYQERVIRRRVRHAGATGVQKSEEETEMKGEERDVRERGGKR